MCGGGEEFPPFHPSVPGRVIRFFAPAIVLLALVNGLLIWLHHPAISTWLIVLTAAIHLLMVGARLTVFLPIQKQLDKAKSMELSDRLVKYDVYLGSGFPSSIKIIATIVMLYQVVSASSH